MSGGLFTFLVIFWFFLGPPLRPPPPAVGLFYIAESGQILALKPTALRTGNSFKSSVGSKARYVLVRQPFLRFDLKFERRRVLFFWKRKEMDILRLVQLQEKRMRRKFVVDIEVRLCSRADNDKRFSSPSRLLAGIQLQLVAKKHPSSPSRHECNSAKY